MQNGYSVRGNFDISTAPHLIEPFRCIADPYVRVVSIRAAIQTLKSLIADITVPYWIEHDPGDILWLFENDQKAKDYAETRVMPLLRSIPGIQRLLLNVDRHDKTKTKILFPDCKLDIGGLNESNVQSFSYRYVIIDETWMARANGLIRQAIARTTQYPETKKILLLGQGGIEDEDADKEHKKTDMRELQFACPFCGFAQAFDLFRLRAEDFPDKSLRGTHSGLSWDTNEHTKPGGKWNFEAAGKSAHIRCYQCNARIEDRPAVRRQLAASYTHKPTNPGAPSDSVGFWWPQPASTRLVLSKMVETYLQAKQASDEMGYRLELQEFYQKLWGLTWSESLTTEYRALAHEPYDVTSDWPDEAHRVLIADCQRDLAKFFYSVFALSLVGEARELARGQCGSFDELAAIQTEWKVKDQHTFLDCGYRMTDVLRECVRRGHKGSLKIGGRVHHLWLCWTGLKGSSFEMFTHVNPKTKVKQWRIYSERKLYDVNLGKSGGRQLMAPYYEWSNLHAKDLLRPRRDGEPGLPKLRTLPDTLPSTDMWSHFAQMRSERRTEKFVNGKKEARWELIKESRPNHEWDKCAMLMAIMALFGIIGPGEVEPEKTDQQ